MAGYSSFLDKDKRPTPLTKDMPPIVAIPTTAGAGSEATPWALITDKGAKRKFGVGNALMLPHQMAYSLSGELHRYARIGEALNVAHPLTGTFRLKAERAVEAVRELVVDSGLPTRLQDVGVTKEMIPELTAGAYRDQNWLTNPKSIDQADLEQLYRQAL